MLHIHRAERADGLVEALRALLADPLPDPFAPELVAVPTRGMERWLTQRMSDRLGARPGRADGVCANVEFPAPAAVVSAAIATAAGIDPDADPWLTERMVWPLLELVDAALDEPWLDRLAAHLDATPGRARRFAAVRHIAWLFDRYALHRPELVRAWADGADDGWQAELWRRLRARIGVPDPVERLESACARLQAEPGLLELPERLSVFGLTRLPAGHLRVLRALAAGRDVHLFLLHPSPVLWERVADAVAGPIERRADDVTTGLPVNRLLGSWGHDARELQLVVGGGEHRDHHHPVAAPRADTLLARLQADVRADRGPAPPGDAPRLDRADRSVQVHACHGRARQVEVLRDAILHLLAEDPSLEPRDVIVMCPDIEAFAPLIHATFGAGEAGGDEDDDELEATPPELRAPDLRVRLADRSVRQTNPLLGVVARLLELADERMTASQLLDFADRAPVRRRFRLGDDDLVRIGDWVAEAGIRWGLDAAHRAPFKLGEVANGTWAAGLDRLLLGVTMTEEELRLFHNVLPLDDVESGSIDLAGRFAELVDRIGAAVAALRGPQPISAWAEAIAGAAGALTETPPYDSWQDAELQRMLGDVVAEAAGAEAELSLPDVRALLAERLRGRPTRANFRTGHLTVCTLVPMRSVPHRVVCLLGLDDGAFPRKSPRDGDDLLLEDPHVGERDARMEDRQLLLDALMAATDRLVIIYTGHDERTNLVRPPAVPVGELLDVIDRTVRAEDGPARAQVVVHHPLQPFDPRNFTPGRLVPRRPWSFDRLTLDGARALAGPRLEPGPFIPAPLPGEPPVLLELDELVRFVEQPVRRFLRLRLGITVGFYADEPDDGLPVELDPLELWGVGRRLLAARLAGADPRTAALAEIARGTLPPAALGRPVLEAVHPIVAGIAAHAGTGAGRAVDVRVTLPGGRALGGTVAGVAGDELRTATYSRVRPRQRLAAWVRLVALTAADPDRPYAAVTVGRARVGKGVTIARIAPLGPDAATRRERAVAELATLVDLFDRGMREPPPLYCRTSAAYVAEGAAAARLQWESGYNREGEDDAPEHRLVFGRRVPFEALTAAAPQADERGAGWDERETTRFGRHAHRLWDGLLACEELIEP